MATPYDVGEEKRNLSPVFFFTVVVLFVCTLLAVYDESVTRRPWKELQRRFYLMLGEKLGNDRSSLVAKLDADPAYQEAKRALEEYRAERKK